MGMETWKALPLGPTLPDDFTTSSANWRRLGLPAHPDIGEKGLQLSVECAGANKMVAPLLTAWYFSLDGA